MPVDTAMSIQSPARSLAQLLGKQARNMPDIPIAGIAYDSRSIHHGDVFFALPGSVADGAIYAAQAVQNGAVTVVAERDLPVNVPVIIVPNARQAMADASLRFYARPDQDLDLYAMIGTNGKSTVAAGIETIFTKSGIASGLIGTITYRWGAHTVPAPRTTPEAPDLIGLLDRMRADGVKAVALEVSSHAIALDRVHGIHFRGGVFTNVTRDHLDFHKTFEEYRRVKSSFFERLAGPDTFAAINVDDPSAEFFVRAASGTRIIRYSGHRNHADVGLQIISHSLRGSRGHLLLEGETWPFGTPLWGAFNHANLAAMAAVAWGAGLTGGQIADGISAFSGIPGRLERVESDAPFDVFVDYAHTPDALDAVLSSARPLVRGRLLVVFGCGGDRDRGKRPEMAAAVQRWADRIYLTSDNPRSEDPKNIINEVNQGFTSGKQIWCDPDRVRAIEQSLTDAQPGDAVFLCGKGHELTQEIAGVFHRFSDQETAARILAASGHSPRTLHSVQSGFTPGSAVGPGGDPSPTR